MVVPDDHVAVRVELVHLQPSPERPLSARGERLGLEGHADPVAAPLHGEARDHRGFTGGLLAADPRRAGLVEHRLGPRLDPSGEVGRGHPGDQRAVDHRRRAGCGKLGG